MDDFYIAAINIGALLIALGYPFVRIVRVGNFKKGVLLTWGCLVLYGLLWGMIIPFGLLAIDPNTEDFVVKVFPEFAALTFIVNLLFGWITGMLVSSVGVGLHEHFVKSKESK